MRIIFDEEINSRPEPFGTVPFCPPTVCYNGGGGDGSSSDGYGGYNGLGIGNPSSYGGKNKGSDTPGTQGSDGSKSIVETARDQGWKSAKTTGEKQESMANVNAATNEGISALRTTMNLLGMQLGPMAIVPATIIAAGVYAYNKYGPNPDGTMDDGTGKGKGEGDDAGDRQRAAAAAAKSETKDTKTTETIGSRTPTLAATVETLGNALLNPWAQTLFTSGRGVRGTAPVKRKSLLGA